MKKQVLDFVMSAVMVMLISGQLAAQTQEATPAQVATPAQEATTVQEPSTLQVEVGAVCKAKSS